MSYEIQISKSDLEKLKQSPVFNFSLSSKELFHSNFLFWLCKEPASAGHISRFFAMKSGLTGSDFILESPQRETANIDLMFKIKNESGQSRRIVIENKVKSLPYQLQLEEYSGSLDDGDTSFFLISLSRPEFFSDGQYRTPGGQVWHFIGYGELNDFLSTITQSDNLQNYHRHIIHDYRELVTVLLKIENACQFDLTEHFNYSGSDICRLLIDKEVKLHDFYLKKKYERFAFALYERLRNKGLLLSHFGQLYHWEDESTVSVLYGMTRGEGLADIKIKFVKGASLGIQIQGNHYRLTIDLPADFKKSDEALERLNTVGYFDFLDSSVDVYPQKKAFNRYGSRFYYKYIKLVHKTNLDVINMLLADIERITNDLPSYSSRLNDLFD